MTDSAIQPVRKQEPTVKGAGVLEEIKKHLEFLGYSITHRDKFDAATHPQRANVLLREFGGGVLFMAGYNVNDTAKQAGERLQYLEFINGMNKGASVARWYVGDDSRCVVEAWFPSFYEKSAFGVFVDGWHRDTEQLVASAFVRDAQKYLGTSPPGTPGDLPA